MSPENFSLKIKVGSRGSPLAQVQVKEVLALMEESGMVVSFESKVFETKGDRDRTTSLTADPGDDFFTDTLDLVLMSKEIDIAIHSAKDVPRQLRPELEIFALTKTLDETDALAGPKRLDQLPAGACVATSSTLRRQEIRARYPHLQTADIRGNIHERLQQVKDGKYAGVIVATCALKRLGLEKEIAEILPWEGFPLQGQLAVVGRRGDSKIQELFSAIDVRRRYGRVTLVGAGPGAPELITLKGVKALESADCVFYDYLIDRSLLNHAPRAEKIDAGKRKGKHTIKQSELNQMMKEKAVAGKNVVRLKGGDPLVFGRGADEITYLENYHIETSVIPGVSSATGLPSMWGIPLTARGVSSSVAFLSGHTQNDEGEPLPIRIPDVETVVFLMGLTKLPEIIEALCRKGWETTTPVVVISRGTMPGETVVRGTLADIEQKAQSAQLQPPALIIAGGTAGFCRRKGNDQKKFLYLGTHPDKYRMLGEVIHHPMISIRERALNQNEIDGLKSLIPGADWLLFTSRHAVEHFLKICEKIGVKQSLLQQIPAASIGRETSAALTREGFTPAVTAGEESSEGMFRALQETGDLRGKRVIFPRSSLPNPYLKTELSKNGADVFEIAVYENVKPMKRDLPKTSIETIIFSSPSTVNNFLEDYAVIPAGWKILCKGERTRRALKEAGYGARIISDEL